MPITTRVILSRLWQDILEYFFQIDKLLMISSVISMNCLSPDCIISLGMDGPTVNLPLNWS